MKRNIRATGVLHACQAAGTPPRPSWSEHYYAVFCSVTEGHLSNSLSQVALLQLQFEQGGAAMTTLLKQAFDAAAKLPEAEQDLLAARVLAELAAEDEFDRAIAASGDKLGPLAAAAVAEFRAGQTHPLHPER
jgi:hypothetical protein